MKSLIGTAPTLRAGISTTYFRQEQVSLLFYARLAETSPEIIDNYHHVQQDVMETFIDRGQLRKLAEPTSLSNGRRIPGLKLDHPRQLAVIYSLVGFAPIAGGGKFTTADLYAPALDALGARPRQNTRWRRFATTSPSYAPKDWSNEFRSRVAPGWSRKATRFAWPSLNCSRKSTRLLPQVCSSPSAEIACWRKRNAANSIACISASR